MLWNIRHSKGAGMMKIQVCLFGHFEGGVKCAGVWWHGALQGGGGECAFFLSGSSCSAACGKIEIKLKIVMTKIICFIFPSTF